MPLEALHAIMLVTKQPSQQQAASWFADLTHHIPTLPILLLALSLYSPSYSSGTRISNSHFPLTHKPHIAYNHSISPLQYPNPSNAPPYGAIAPSISTLIQPKSFHTPPLQRILDAMKAHPGNPDVIEWACNAIANLARDNASNRAAIAAAGGIMVC